MTHAHPPSRGQIRIGIGGWSFAPWRGVFYPESLPQKKELSYAADHLTAIEINSTYYSLQKPDTWRKWASQTPEGFVFTVKGSQFATNRRVLAEAGPAIDRFVNQGLVELGSKLGPILWQLAHTKKFDQADLDAFLALLPRQIEGVALRHCLEPRHESFRDPAFAALLRRHEVAMVCAEHETYPTFADVTGDFAYVRLQTGSDEIETAYPASDLDAWAGRLKTWAAGGRPADLACADPSHTPEPRARDVFAFFIRQGKVRAPAGAMALIDRCAG